MVKDTLKLELHNTTAPFSLVQSSTLFLDSTGAGLFSFPPSVIGSGYYLAVRHRNALETWSSSPVSFSGKFNTYDFTSSASQAYGNNLILKGSKWCLYSGDANQDGQISLDDLLSIDVDNQNFNTGYLSTDVNGDGQVTLDDLLITDVNNQNFISVQKPGLLKRKPSR